MDAYIVRIFRRNARDPHAMNGVVEVVGDPTPKIIARAEEVVAIIAKRPADTSPEAPTGSQADSR